VLYTNREQSMYVLYFGLLLFVLEIRIQKNLLVTGVVATHIYFFIDSLKVRVARYGVDTTAYIVQDG